MINFVKKKKMKDYCIKKNFYPDRLANSPYKTIY